jgi:hypothetical protein
MWSYAINCHNVSQYNIDNQKKKKKTGDSCGFHVFEVFVRDVP